jgi:hypothetical protein
MILEIAQKEFLLNIMTIEFAGGRYFVLFYDVR